MYRTLELSDNFRRAAANASPPSRINFTGDEVSFHGNLSTTSAIATFWPIRTYRTLDTAAKNFQTNAARSTFVVAHTTPSPIPPQARGMRRRREVFSFLPTTPPPFFFSLLYSPPPPRGHCALAPWCEDWRRGFFCDDCAFFRRDSAPIADYMQRSWARPRDDASRSTERLKSIINKTLIYNPRASSPGVGQV